VAVRWENGTIHLPGAAGSGETVARSVLTWWFGFGDAEVRPLATLPASGVGPVVEIWAATGARAARPGVTWQPLDEALARLTTTEPRDWDAIAALTVVARSGLTTAGALRAAPHRPRAPAPDRRELPGVSDTGVGSPPAAALIADGPSPFLNAELSLVAFAARVLAVAEDTRTPLLERIRFLAIVSGNVDELFMVRVAALKRAAAQGSTEVSPDGLTPREQLEAIALRVPPLIARQRRCWRECIAELARHGTRILRWDELEPAARAQLRERFRDEILPALTPLAMTLSPGHPFPFVSHHTLALAVTLAGAAGGPARFAEVELPDDLPRLMPVPGGGDFVLLEDVVRGNLELLHPGRRIEQAHVFRVTRAGDLELDAASTSLIDAVEAAARRRATSAVVRVEVERGMPSVLRGLLLAELGREAGGRGVGASATLTESDVHEVDGPLDLGGLATLSALHIPALRYPPFQGRDPLAGAASLWGVLRERDLLFHHPYDRWDATALRFFAEAADDPDVTAIKLTLYRAGEHSPVVDALRRAAAAGKEVVAFVELTARFDEERNVAWATALERAGARMVHGLVGLKNHAKVALVVRREAGGVGRATRYVHIGTGNYNAETARGYTDLSLLSADEELGADVSELFNELTGSPGAPEIALRRCLVAPRYLLSEILERIRREAAHARSGRGGLIRIKVNGLSDPEVVNALRDASRAGVSVDLLVRGICTLRPGVPGVTERIRVRATVDRFLEHARIYHFANGGQDEYFIGSGDLRSRNLRRRVELLAPITDAACRARLDGLLTLELEDAAAWELTPHGEYVRERGDRPSMQERLLAEVANAAK
ncbi:MAG: polyphosphate kinase 1, partial [Gemmatimonadota bacterium]|nr:polyphosphate kinase 1 [Gemmatimonadota bacterium]